MFGEWIIEQYSDKVKVVGDSFDELTSRFSIKEVKTESRTYFDWDYYKNNCYEYSYFLPNVEMREEQLKSFLVNSELSSKKSIYCLPGFKRKTWMIETSLFIDKWFEFETLAVGYVPFISEDGKLFFEFANAGGWYLISNFQVAPKKAQD